MQAGTCVNAEQASKTENAEGDPLVFRAMCYQPILEQETNTHG